MEITNTTLKMLLRDFNNGEMSIADARNILNEIAPSLDNDELEFVEEMVLMKVEEEFEAWKHGYNLAHDLKIPIDKKGYEVIKSRYLATYMMNAMSRKVKFEIRNGIKEDRERRLKATELTAKNQLLSQVNESQVNRNDTNGETSSRKEIKTNEEK